MSKPGESQVVVPIEASASPPSSASYLENYRILADTARELREQDEVDIDRLVPLVDRALSAYSACKGRIEAVERMLLDRLGGEEPQAE